MRVVLPLIIIAFVIAVGSAILAATTDTACTRVEVRIESPYPEFTCQEDELMLWVDRSNGLARCVNIEEYEAAL